MASIRTESLTLNIELLAVDLSTVATLKLDYPKQNLTRVDVENAVDKLFKGYSSGNRSNLDLICNSRGIVATLVGKVEEVSTVVVKTELQ